MEEEPCVTWPSVPLRVTSGRTEGMFRANGLGTASMRTDLGQPGCLFPFEFPQGERRGCSGRTDWALPQCGRILGSQAVPSPSSSLRANGGVFRADELSTASMRTDLGQPGCPFPFEFPQGEPRGCSGRTDWALPQCVRILGSQAVCSPSSSLRAYPEPGRRADGQP